MEKVVTNKVVLPSWIFVVSIVIHSLAPVRAKDFAYLLLLVAYVDTFLQAQGQGATLRKFTLAVSWALKALWVAGFIYALTR